MTILEQIIARYESVYLDAKWTIDYFVKPVKPVEYITLKVVYTPQEGGDAGGFEFGNSEECDRTG